jgi:hypothetical protein
LRTNGSFSPSRQKAAGNAGRHEGKVSAIGLGFRSPDEYEQSLRLVRTEKKAKFSAFLCVSAVLLFF